MRNLEGGRGGRGGGAVNVSSKCGEAKGLKTAMRSIAKCPVYVTHVTMILYSQVCPQAHDSNQASDDICTFQAYT